MKFDVTDEIFKMFPDLRIGVVVGEGLQIRKSFPRLQEIVEENSRLLKERVGDKSLNSFPNINAWRETYRRFGVSPKKYKPTAEALLRRVIKNQGFPNINTAADAYLAAELVTMLPVGGYDLDTIEGDIRLLVSPGDETFHPLGGGEPEVTAPGEIVYKDDKQVLTRNWNYRDCDFTKITENTTRMILAVEAALGEIETKDVELTLEKIAEYTSICCQGTYRTYMLDSKNSAVDINS